MEPRDPLTISISGVEELIGSKRNKILTGASEEQEGVVGDPLDELELDLTDEELLQLSKRWTAKYATYEQKIKLRQLANETYYLGRQKEGSAWATTDGMPIAANLIFEAEETFLPAAFAKNPEPVVWSDNTQAGQEESDTLKTMLQYHASVLCLRSKLQLMTRKWTIDFLGVIKHGWDDDIKEIMLEVRNARDFIFDPDGYVDVYGDFEGYLGERITIAASKLVDLFPHEKDYITVMVDGKMGTDVTYTEWWTDEYTFTTFKERVLDASKNPHFNYKKKVYQKDVLGRVAMKPDGTPVMKDQQKRNHFFKPKKPYTFLSVFSLGEHPHDITGLIEQNIPNQRRISRRTEQLDYNLSRANNSRVFSANNWTQETAKQASTAMAKGHPVIAPQGISIKESIEDFPAMAAPAAFFQELEVSKEDLRGSFGTLGLTATPPEPNNLATGIIANEQHDSSRIGGGIGDKIEQAASNIFNWFVQEYYVYYDELHEASIMGQQQAVEYVQLKAANMDRKFVVSVSPDSMKPRDESSEMNQAMQLFEAGVLDPKTLFTKLNYPDPQNTAEQATLWMVDKMSYMALNFPKIAQQVQQMQQQQAQAQQQQSQQQAQNEAQGGQIQNEQKAQSGQQQLQQSQQAHEQKLKQSEEAHKLKLKQQEEVQKAKPKVEKKEDKSKKK